MNYELAKKLKDAGFPQHHDTAYGRQYQFDKEDDLIFIHKGGIGRSSVDNSHDEGDITLLPTLSELIEACGLAFALQSENDGWFAQRFGEGKENVGVTGETPEIAVANLYLKLHEQNL